jgi:AcrR family transcriptional regulator
MGAPVLTPRRTDARRNRQVILKVADEAFAQGTGVVSLAEIARRAGLGRATVYRHFPDKQALGAAVAAEQLTALRQVVRAAEGDRRCFRELLHLVLCSQVSRRSLVQLLRELPDRDRRQHANALIAVLTTPFRQAQAEGRLRADVQPTDLALVFEMIDAGVEAVPASGDRNAAAQRLIAVVLDGLFTAPLPD